ncbi:uncharacterized protein N0V89_011366 [Didymosphaeria variabile]|uniref:PNPLA domain-containing protein n=1 Tax=Didymosphaeria variabile TaxID=1932322 RepID=A0A9W8XBJ9_9PLEO|nr:uncharacterized protein N0V89_011366 [Didymosphaeria variabile]KAJ4345237.1 hypothetical protein N0V89_011366 [Didymosphaeria variabile]
MLAMMALREGDRKRGEGDKCHLFRSYDHVEAPPRGYNLSDANQLNPGRVQSNPTMIWEACRATSAAPLYFDKMMLGGVRYMDGGVGQNNPVEYALNEAHQMCAGGDQYKKVAAALISVGTGHKKPQSRFQNILHIMKWARKSITNTQDAHFRVEGTCKGLDIPYFRFDVKTGLSKMKLDECKKERAKKKPENIAQANGSANPAALASALPEPVQTLEKPLFDSYQPEKYDYTTYNTIKNFTLTYCHHKGGDHNNPVDVDGELTNAAELLVYYRRKREASSRQKWDNFSTHPYVRVNQLLNGLNREPSFPARAQA